MSKLDAALETLVRTLQASTVRVHDGRRGSGSGIIWNAAGLIVTNAHVACGSTATVEFPDGATLRAPVVRRDTDLDLAALRPIADLPTGESSLFPIVKVPLPPTPATLAIPDPL